MCINVEERRNQNAHFAQYVNMIRSAAHKYSKALHVEYDDLVDTGYEIYSWCLRNYKGSKGASFGTYFFIQLGQRMKDQVAKDRRRISCLYDDLSEDGLSYEQLLVARENCNMLDVDTLSVSYEAKMVLHYLTSFDWCTNRLANPTKKFVQSQLGLSQVAIDSAWDEIQDYWCSTGWKVCC